MAERILVVDDESGPREGLRRLLEAWGYDTASAASADEALEQIERERPSAVITDLVMPGMDGLEFVRRVHLEHALPVVVFSGQGTIDSAVEAMKLGAVDFLEKPVEPARLKILLQKFASTRELIADNRRLRAELRERGALGRLRGASEKMRIVYRQIEQVAPSTLSVLIVGESGTGKELVAQTLHDLSPRKKSEFVAINCAAIPSSLLESEIFGHERGAFTGAVQRKIGCFEMAHRGTLFLDEISEMDELLQAKLLRVLQEQKFRRVGGREIIECDVRVIAATNREPMRAIAEGKLREDLYYRLNVFAIHLPSLRERPEDIVMLARHFAEEYASRTGTPISPLHPTTLERLLTHGWPGNIRELKNAIERSALLAGGTPILPEHLPQEVCRAAAERPGPAAFTPVVFQGGAQASPVAPMVALRVGVPMEEAERELIRSTLAHTSGNKTRAAKILGISLKTMHNKVKKFGL
ncbi:MAG TPA: sigma-54 dependent transcriptional regulator [Candidatus Polarisedimenticolaceae bacterium]